MAKRKSAHPNLTPEKEAAVTDGIDALIDVLAGGENDGRLRSAFDLFRAVLRQATPLPAAPFDPALCMSCSEPMVDANLYCSDLCSQEADLVRYVRRAIGAGRLVDVDLVRDGIGTPLLMLTAGGYPTKARAVSDDLRHAILLRDGARCRICGSGPPLEIDHISGSNSDWSNLQALCKKCNGEKMAAAVVSVTEESDPEAFAFIRNQRDRLAARIAATVPIRACDDEVAWAKSWQRYKREKKLHYAS